MCVRFRFYGWVLTVYAEIVDILWLLRGFFELFSFQPCSAGGLCESQGKDAAYFEWYRSSARTSG